MTFGKPVPGGIGCFDPQLRPKAVSPDAKGTDDLTKRFSPNFPSTVAFQIADPAATAQAHWLENRILPAAVTTDIRAAAVEFQLIRQANPCLLDQAVLAGDRDLVPRQAGVCLEKWILDDAGRHGQGTRDLFEQVGYGDGFTGLPGSLAMGGGSQPGTAPMMSATAAVSACDGSRSAVRQNEGQPESYWGQSPCRMKVSPRPGSHCGSARASPFSAHQAADQDSDRT